MRMALIELASPQGNWGQAWKALCEMAELDSEELVPPFTETRHENVSEVEETAGSPQWD